MKGPNPAGIMTIACTCMPVRAVTARGLPLDPPCARSVVDRGVPQQESRMNIGFQVAIGAVSAVLALGSATAAEPYSRPLADAPGAAAALLKNQPRLPAPIFNVLTASLDAQGRVTIRCSADENPAYRAWREAAARRGVQER
ncbi:MAG: hypothetical protein ACK558_07360 [Pseudomonadota bacterium]